jgi:hypothetical protein
MITSEQDFGILSELRLDSVVPGAVADPVGSRLRYTGNLYFNPAELRE